MQLKTKNHRQVVSIESVRAIDGSDEVELSFSSESPYDRGGSIGLEVLSHDKDSVRLERLNSGASVLWNHDPNAVIGTVSKAWIDDDTRKGKARIRFGTTKLAMEIASDVKAGIRRLVSVGYTILKATKTKMGTLAEVWEPHEISLVSIPADITVGIGRSKETFTKEKNIMENQNFDILETIEKFTKRGMNVPAGLATRAATEGWDGNRLAAEIIDAQPREISGRDQRSINSPAKAETPKFSLCRTLRSLADNRQPDGFEGEVIAEFQRTTGRTGRGLMVPDSAFSRDFMAAGAFGLGGSTVSTDMGGLVEKLDAVPVIEQAGATVLRGLTGNVSLPRQTTGATAYWVAEGASITQSAVGTDDITMTPHGVAATVTISKQLLAQGSLDIENLVRSDIMKRINLAIDKAALIGSGSAGQPKGIFNLDTATSGINTVEFGAAATWAKLLEFGSKLADLNALQGRLGWILSPTVAAKLKAGLKDAGSGQFLMDATGIDGSAVFQTTQMAGSDFANRVLFGNFADAIVARWAGVDLVVDPYTLSDSGRVRVTALVHCDVAFRHPESFAVSTDNGNQ